MQSQISSDAEDNTSGRLNRGGIAESSLLRTLLAICQKSREPGFWEVIDSFRDLCKQLWCPLYGTKKSVIQSNFETQSSCMYIHIYIYIYIFFFSFFFSPLIYNHTASSQLYCKYLQNLQRLHARFAQSAKTSELNLRNTARKMLDKNAMLALSPKPNVFVCWLGNDNSKEIIRR